MKVWIVEMLCNYSRFSRWEPTVGIGLTRDAARQEAQKWRRQIVGEFRVRPYVKLK